MARPTKLLGFALCSAFQTLPERSRREPLQAARSRGAARDRVLWKHPVPDGLWGFPYPPPRFWLLGLQGALMVKSFVGAIGA
jgi:hypothetical protein